METAASSEKSPPICPIQGLGGIRAAEASKGRPKRQSMLAYFTTTYITNVGINLAAKAKIIDVVRDHLTFRAHVGFKRVDLKPPDMAWRAGWSSSDDAVLSLVEDRALLHIC